MCIYFTCIFIVNKKSHYQLTHLNGLYFCSAGGWYDGHISRLIQSPSCLIEWFKVNETFLCLCQTSTSPAGQRQPGTHFPKQAGAGSAQVSSHGFPQSAQILGPGHVRPQLDSDRQVSPSTLARLHSNAYALRISQTGFRPKFRHRSWSLKKSCVISFKLANLNTGMIKWIWMKYFMTRGKAWSLQNCAFFMGLSARARMLTIILNQNLNRLIKNWIELTGGTMHWGLTRWG